MRNYSLLLILLFFYQTTEAQLAMGKWRTHLAYNNTNIIAKTDNKVFAVSDGVLYSVSVDENAVKVLDKTVGLSDSNVGNIAYDSANKQLLITYKNGNIDILSEKGVKNIPDLYNKTMNADKNVNQITYLQDKAYLSCNFGIMVVNTLKKEITDTYYIGQNGSEISIQNIVILNNTLFALSKNSIYYASLSNPNLVDYSQWQTLQNIPGTGNIAKILACNNELILLRAGKMYAFSGTAWRSILPNYSAVNLFSTENNLVVYNSPTDLHLFDKNYNNTTITNAGEVAGIEIDKESGDLWLAGGAKGVVQYSVTNLSALNTFKPNGPAVNSPWSMKFAGERLIVIPGGLTNVFFDNPGGLMIYENNNWKNVGNKFIENQTGLDCQDFVSLSVDPDDKKHFFVASIKTGIYEFYDTLVTKLYNYRTTNGVIENLFNSDYYNMTDATQFDNNGNLWLTNSYAKKSIKIRKKDGTWLGLGYDELRGKTNLQNLIFSNPSKNLVWINNYRVAPGLFVLDYNGTIDDTSDDKKIFISTFTDGDGNKISPTNTYCLVEDLDHNVWLGTEQGPLVFYNTSNIFNSNYNCTRIKIPRNDGTGLADYLLQTDKIKAIAVDGANRKWIGTESSGIFLMSDNGQKTIKHFTTSNSPLISNEIMSIAINPVSGEVFIGTSNGLVSYQSDAADGGGTFGNVRAFPNPVRENYTGLISISGLVSNAQVKITDLNGNLIYQTVSNGSIATWDGKNVAGKKVSTGIYLILCINEDGSESIATKLLVIN